MNFNKGNSRAIIVCAACRCEGIVIAGARHFDKIMHTQIDAMDIKWTSDDEQGFIDQFGNFYSRVEALKTILRNDLQLINWDRNGSTTELYSEGLY